MLLDLQVMPPNAVGKPIAHDTAVLNGLQEGFLGDVVAEHTFLRL